MQLDSESVIVFSLRGRLAGGSVEGWVLSMVCVLCCEHVLSSLGHKVSLP